MYYKIWLTGAVKTRGNARAAATIGFLLPGYRRFAKDLHTILSRELGLWKLTPWYEKRRERQRLRAELLRYLADSTKIREQIKEIRSKMA